MKHLQVIADLIDLQITKKNNRYHLLANNGMIMKTTESLYGVARYLKGVLYEQSKN